MNKSVVRLGIIGAGTNMTVRHIPNFQALEEIEITGVCNRSLESSQKVAAQFNIPKVYNNWLELVNDPEIDAVAIGTWPYMHCPVTIASIRANKHVLCEARMAMNAREAYQMAAAATQKPNLICQVVPSPITLRVDKHVKKLIFEDYLGEILAIEIEDGGSFLDYDAPLHWRQDIDLSGHNMMSLGIWYEALMRWVGDSKKVMAMGKTFVQMRKDNNHGDYKTVQIPEHVDVIADMACGALAHIRISAVTGLAKQPDAVLYGSKGTLRFASDKLYGGKKGDKKLKEIQIPFEEEGRWRVEEEFINAIKGRESVTNTTFNDGLKYMVFTDAVFQSIETGMPVILSELPLY